MLIVLQRFPNRVDCLDSGHPSLHLQCSPTMQVPHSSLLLRPEILSFWGRERHYGATPIQILALKYTDHLCLWAGLAYYAHLLFSSQQNLHDSHQSTVDLPSTLGAGQCNRRQKFSPRQRSLQYLGVKLYGYTQTQLCQHLQLRQQICWLYWLILTQG